MAVTENVDPALSNTDLAPTLNNVPTWNWYNFFAFTGILYWILAGFFAISKALVVSARATD